MKNLGALIRKHLEDNGMSQATACRLIGLKTSHFNQLLNRSSMSCELYERICRALKINPLIGFDDDLSLYGNTSLDVIQQLTYLRSLLDEKERYIQLLESLVPGQKRDKAEENTPLNP